MESSGEEVIGNNKKKQGGVNTGHDRNYSLIVSKEMIDTFWKYTTLDGQFYTENFLLSLAGKSLSVVPLPQRTESLDPSSSSANK